MGAAFAVAKGVNTNMVRCSSWSGVASWWNSGTKEGVEDRPRNSKRLSILRAVDVNLETSVFIQLPSLATIKKERRFNYLGILISDLLELDQSAHSSSSADPSISSEGFVELQDSSLSSTPR